MTWSASSASLCSRPTSSKARAPRSGTRAPALSALEIVRQYQAELGGKGFEIVYDSSKDPNAGDYTNFLAPFSQNEPRNNRSTYVLYAASDSTVRSTTLKRSGDSGETWVSIIAVDWAQPDATYKAVQGAYAAVDVIDAAAMKKDIQFVSAADMQKSLTAAGKVALYGIYFDTNQATLKPESKPTLDEIAQLLAADPALKVHVVGHTDNQGGLDSNLSLSKRRAEAVRAALINEHGIAAERLAANGVSYLAPVASNADEAGRAKNRRVELVPFLSKPVVGCWCVGCRRSIARERAPTILPWIHAGFVGARLRAMPLPVPTPTPTTNNQHQSVPILNDPRALAVRRSAARPFTCHKDHAVPQPARAAPLGAQLRIRSATVNAAWR
ncbi:MAG: OmpA family protein [Rhodanobacteraceae bacterium]|nr:OmpA family protein [Rhodanobacteraceae bacterium]